MAPKTTSDEVNALMEGLQNSDYAVSVDMGNSEDVRPLFLAKMI